LLTSSELATERRLIEASQKDPRRFEDLYERYFDRVYAFALARTGDRTAAEDVTADTFRQAFQNLDRFQWRGVPFSAWLFRIAANNATDVGLKRGRETTLDEVPEAPSSGWEEEFLEVEDRVRVIEHVKRLPKDQRQVIAMRFGQERSIREVARAMDRSEGAVKQLQFRALQNLRGWIGETYER
jgi:RNA polymerase sigma-70 factor (ECF subfamily)